MTRPQLGLVARSLLLGQHLHALLPELVIQRVQQPAAETRAVLGDDRQAEGAARLGEEADARRASDQDIGTLIAGEVAEADEMVVLGLE